MNIVVVNGSTRANSQSLKVSNWLVEHAKNNGEEPSLIDLHQLTLPIYDVGETDAPNAETITQALDQADAVVMVSPEWNGMMSQGIVNMLQYVDKELAHKPVMNVGVSSGRGGHYPLMQMRVMGYKNNQLVISPEALLVQGVNDIMNSHNPAEDTPDESVQKRADYALKVLVEYAKALKLVRDSGVIDHESYGNGV